MRRILFALLLAAPVAHADPIRDAVINGVLRCDAITDNRAWLDCFYGSAQPMRSRLGLSPAPQAQTKLVPPVGAGYMAAAPAYRRAAPPPKEKGFWAELAGSDAPVARNMPLASYSFDKSGRFTIKLENGQTYQQMESDTAHASWNGAPASLLVTINNSGDNYTVKVKSEPGAVYHARRR